MALATACTLMKSTRSDLISVPGDLREILEACLAEEANPTNLEIYLPQVRQIITSLLQGLRVKQSSYRRITERARQNHMSRHELDRRELARSSVAGSLGDSPNLSGRRSHIEPQSDTSSPTPSQEAHNTTRHSTNAVPKNLL